MGGEGANYPQAVILSLEAMSYNLENSLETVGFFASWFGLEVVLLSARQIEKIGSVRHLNCLNRFQY